MGDNNKNSLTKGDYIDPKKTNTEIKNEKRDTFRLMNTNFLFGDKENPNNTYLTVYKNKLNGQPCNSPAKNQKKRFNTNFKISNNQDNDFISEKQLRYLH